MAEQWRVGRKIPKNLYKGDLDVGRMDTAELAAEVVETMNELDGRLTDFLDSGRFAVEFVDKLVKGEAPVQILENAETLTQAAEQVLENFLFGTEGKS
jgi:hypothetical protein